MSAKDKSVVSPVRRWKRVVLVVAGLALTLYAGSYCYFRLHDDIIHERSADGMGASHEVFPAQPNYRLIGVGAVLTKDVDEAKRTVAAVERRRHFLAAFYAPLIFVETQAWRIAC